jgi:hypothetical protein
MRVAPDALGRLAGAKFTSETVAQVLDFMRQRAELTGATSSALTFDFQKAEDQVTLDDLIPVLTIALRPATINVSTAPEVLRDTKLPQQPGSAAPAGDAPVPGPGSSPIPANAP